MKSFKELKEVAKPTGKLKDACWSGYTAVGTKMKGGRKVPNCVPEELDLTEKKDEMEYSDPYMAVNQLRTIMHNAQEMIDMIGEKTDLPEWVESKITLAEDYIMTVANYMRSEMKEETELDEEIEIDEEAFEEIIQQMTEEELNELIEEIDSIDEDDEEELDESAAWQRKAGKDPKGGLNRKGIASYRRENPGSKLSMAVTTKPSKLKKGSKAWNRRKSFCARMSGMKRRLTSAKTARDPNSRINKSLRKWNC